MSLCHEIQERFSELYDGELPAEDRSAVEGHFTTCGTCREEYEAFRSSLETLQTTGSMEVAEKFDTTVSLALAAEAERDELFRQTGLQEKPPEIRIVYRTPKWVPWTVAAGVIFGVVAAGLFFAKNDVAGSQEFLSRISLLEKERDDWREKAVRPQPLKPREELLKEWGFVPMGDAWVPPAMQERLEKGDVLVDGELLARASAYERLSGGVRKPDPVPVPPPMNPPPAVAPDQEELLTSWGFENVGGFWVPGDWARQLESGRIMTGPGQFLTREDFEKEYLAAHDLVEFEGRIVSRDQQQKSLSQRIVPPAGAVGNEVTAAVEGVEIGVPLPWRGLTLYPLHRRGGGSPYAGLTLAEALTTRKVEVMDDVNPLRVRIRNSSDGEVLVQAGEILEGGRCARVVSDDAVIPRRSTVLVPVFCVEPEAWRGTAQMSRSSGRSLAPPFLMRPLVARKGQGTIWSEVKRHGMEATPKKREEGATELRGLVSSWVEDPGVVGMAVAVDGGIEGAVLYDSHSLFSRSLDGVLFGAVGEQMHHRAGSDSTHVRYPDSVAGVRQLLQEVFLCSFQKSEGGYSLSYREKARGVALVSGSSLRRLYVASDPEVVRENDVPGVPREKVSALLREYERKYRAAIPEERILLVRDLSVIASPATAAQLQRFYAGERDLEVRCELLASLGRRGSPEDGDLQRFLIRQMEENRKEPKLYEASVSALARFGAPGAVPAFLKVLEGGDAVLSPTVFARTPELLLQLRDRRLVENTLGRLIEWYAEVERDDPAPAPSKQDDRRALGASLLQCLRSVTGKDFDRASLFRIWWNDREERERFLRAFGNP